MMLRGRDLRALKAARRHRDKPRRRVLRLSASAQAAVIEALREEFDLLCRGEPSAQDVENALLAAEGRS